jgi:hypothetical protein
MTAAMILQLVVALGPAALGLLRDLIAVWQKPVLTADEVNGIVSRAQKSYDSYIADAKATQTPPTAGPVA